LKRKKKKKKQGKRWKEIEAKKEKFFYKTYHNRDATAPTFKQNCMYATQIMK